MESEEPDTASYAPESPDLSGATPYGPEDVHPQHQTYRGSISLHSPFTPLDSKSPFGRRTSYFGPQPTPVQQHEPAMKDDDDHDYFPGQPTPRPAQRPKRIKAEAQDVGIGNDNGEVEVRTKFPVARIKRIMQADEDVGKVAQVTPVVVCMFRPYSQRETLTDFSAAKALELFMISIVTKAAGEARQRSSKRVLPTHLKQAVLADERFDFLNDIVGKVADAPSAVKHEASDDDGPGAKKKKGTSRKKRKGSDES
jgi:Dr1-associated corepressor